MPKKMYARDHRRDIMPCRIGKEMMIDIDMWREG